MFVEVESGLFEDALFGAPREGAKEAVERLVKGGNLVYVSTESPGLARSRLKEAGVHKAPLLGWALGGVFRDAVEAGLRVRAVIGGPAFVGSAMEYKPRAYSFGEVEGATALEGWSDVPDKP